MAGCSSGVAGSGEVGRAPMHADPRGSGRGRPDRLILMTAAALGGLRRERWVDHGNGEREERDEREEEERDEREEEEKKEGTSRGQHSVQPVIECIFIFLLDSV